MTDEPAALSRQSNKSWRPGKAAILIAFAPTSCVLLLLFANYASLGRGTIWFLFSLTLLSVSVTLVHLYRDTLNSINQDLLKEPRVHIVLHILPFAYFILFLADIKGRWIDVLALLLLVTFFLSGRAAWGKLGALFPSTFIYRIFYRANTAFLTSFPLLYGASLVIPQVISYELTLKVAMFYFSVHFMVLGLSCLKIASDLKGTP